VTFRARRSKRIARLSKYGFSMPNNWSQKIGQGKEAARRFLKENKAVALEIEDKIRGKSAVVADAMYSPPSDDEAKDATEGE
jgi:hypothetical protein